MRVLLSAYGSSGDVKPVVGLAVRLRALGAEVRVCAPPDEEFAERLAGVGVPLVPAGRPVRPMVTGATPRPAADPTLSPWQEPADLNVVQAGAWILPDERPLPAGLVAFLDAGTPPVYVGFGSMPMRASKDVARVAIEAIRAQGRRALVSRGWADLALIDDRDDCLAVGEVNQQALFGRVAAVVHHGGAGTTTTAARAGAPQVGWYPRWWTSHTGPAGWPTWASARHTMVRLRPPSPCQPR